MPSVDVIFLAYTKDDKRYKMLLNAIYTLRNSETNYLFDIKIVESNKLHEEEGFTYPDCKVLVPDEKFNYNKFLNYGLEHCKNDWVVVCNNDLLFSQDWFANIMQWHEAHPEVKSFTPYEPFWHVQRGFNNDNYKAFYGHRTTFELCGWCLVIHRDIIEKCELFDPQFSFVYQDNDYSETIKKAGYAHVLMGNSAVHHLRFKSTDLVEDADHHELYDKQKELFHKKWPDAISH